MFATVHAIQKRQESESPGIALSTTAFLATLPTVMAFQRGPPNGSLPHCSTQTTFHGFASHQPIDVRATWACHRHDPVGTWCGAWRIFFSNLIGTPKEIDIVDVDRDALAATCSRFPWLHLIVHCDDFIDIFLDKALASTHPLLTKTFDAVISNPPYGLFLERAYRARLKRAFPELYVRESYGLFLVFAFSRLRPQGRYVFLIPDTFLASANHKPLRDYLAAHAAPTAIIRFASKRFESVNFGYGNLCVLTGLHRRLEDDDTVKWVEVFEAGVPLSIQAVRVAPEFRGAQLRDSLADGWSLSSFVGYHHTLGSAQTLGDLAECRTGIYTGDNGRFIGYDPQRITRRLNGHPLDWRDVVTRSLSEHERQHGIINGRQYVPLIRGGHRTPFAAPSSAINWSRTMPFITIRPTRRRSFQNSQFYFRTGIAVPMVSAGRISASLMENAVFDQGVVGVFPRDPVHRAPLLLYLNSQVASQAIKSLVNGSANNSANYLKRIPVPALTALACERASEIVKAAQASGTLTSDLCNDFTESLLQDHQAESSRSESGRSPG